MTDEVIAFPDTNVLLHGKAFQTIPWWQLLGANRVVLMLASSVLSDLDRKMHEGQPGLRGRAKRRAKWLHDVRTGKGPRIDPRLSIEFAPVPGAATYEQHELSRDWSDDQLLATVLEHQERTASKCVLVTFDYNMTNRADSRSVRWYRLENKYEMAIPEDRAIGQLRREVERLSASHSYARVELSCEDHSRVLRLSRPLFRPLSNEEIEEEMKKVRLEHPLWRPRGGVFTITKDMATRQNKTLERTYDRYRDYIDQRETYRQVIECTAKVSLRVLNTGSSPARDVRVILRLNAPGVFFVDLEELEEPKAPEFPGTTPWSLALSPAAYLAPAYLPRFPTMHQKPSRVLSVIHEGEALYELDTLMHEMPELCEVSMCMKYDDCSSGGLTYEIHADGQPKATRAEIAVVISDPPHVPTR